MFGFLKKQKITVGAPMSGETIDIKDVNDEVFSKGMMGEGVAIIPDQGEIVSPVDGVVSIVSPTKHAICVTSKEGLELIIHCGIDTVKYHGEGFSVHVEEGKEIHRGDLLFTADLQFFRDKGVDLTSPVLVLNKDAFKVSFVLTNAKVAAGDKVFEVTKI
jgi:glucose-specific phosphotransferase system IIA component